ncbi:hypothetical protein [Deinococcus altitudinis]|uniref:hypothetical protein n=1 Tax=Deinococcus altitudinis TaxID=468914 RepID=UPI003892258D
MSVTQRQIFSTLYGRGPKAVSELARLLYMHPDTISTHILDLEHRRLVVTVLQGNVRICRVAAWVLL